MATDGAAEETMAVWSEFVLGLAEKITECRLRGLYCARTAFDKASKVGRHQHPTRRTGALLRH
jgi:hypothetical protein